MGDQVNKDEIFRRFLDGELEGEEEREALHMIAEEEEMREMLRFEKALYQSAGREADPDSFAVPEGFADRVMSEISGREIQEEPSPGKFKQILEQMITPRPVQLRPVFALAAVLIFALLMVVPYVQQQQETDRIAELDFSGQSVETVSGQDEEVWIRFVYFDEEAESVAVAGDFSEWNPISLNREQVDGLPVWTGLIPVPRGEQRYMFVKDGEEWVTDPLAEIKRDDGFGNKNAVLIL